MTFKFGLAAVASVALAAIATTGALGQSFPSRPVTLIVPWAAGGSSDVSMRALAEATEPFLGQQIIVENKPGASGLLGPSDMAANAEPDGYTIAQVSMPLFRLPFMTDVTYDPATDFNYIIHLTGNTFGVVVNANAPWQTFEELIADAKAHPGEVTYASPGTGTTQHITMEQIAVDQGIEWTHVPFQGGAETNAAVMGGHVDAAADSTGWAGLVNAGELRLLVTWGTERTASWPDVPTLQEAGVDIVSNSPFGLAGPANMDPEVIKVLHDAFRQGMQQPGYIEVLERFDQQEFYMDSDDYTAFALELIEEQKQLVDQLGLGK